MKSNLNFKRFVNGIINMIKNNFKLKLLSLLVGIVMWSLVIGGVNPIVKRSFENVPIKFINQSALEKNKLIMVESSLENITVVVEGTRDEVFALNKKDIIAQATLSEYLSSGTHRISIVVTVPSTVRSAKISDESVNVTLDKEVSKEFDITVDIKGNAKNASQVVTTKEPSEKKVTVTGAVSIINKIKKVVATVDISNMDKDEVVPSKLVVYDEFDNIVKKVKLSEEDTNVSIAFQHLKEVPIELVTLNAPGDGVKILKSDIVPKEVSIVGNADVLENIKSIKTKALDLTQIKESGLYPITLDLPKDTSLINTNTKLMVNIDVDKKIEKTLAIDKEHLEISNPTNKRLVDDLPLAIELTIKGYESKISGINPDNVKLFLKITENSGKFEAKIEMKPIDNVEVIKINPDTAHFTEAND